MPLIEFLDISRGVMLANPTEVARLKAVDPKAIRLIQDVQSFMPELIQPVGNLWTTVRKQNYGLEQDKRHQWA